MSKLALLSVFILCSLVWTTYATPVPTDSDALINPVSAGCLALALCLPFLLLAVLKYVYLKYRRAQTIHKASGANETVGVLSPSVSLHEKRSPLVGLGLDTSSASAAGRFGLPAGLTFSISKLRIHKLLGVMSLRNAFKWDAETKTNLQGYFVGFLGSPHWETRIKVRRDKVERKDLAGLSRYVTYLVCSA